MTSSLSVFELRSVAANNIGVIPAARFDRSRLRRVIDMNDSKSLRVPVTPLEVVEQRPGEIPSYVSAALDCLTDSADMFPKIFDSLRILDLPVDRRRRIWKSRPILRDIERNLTVPLLDPQQNSGERRGINFPADVRIRTRLLQNSHGALRQSLSVVARDTTRVVIHAKKIDRLRNRVHVIGRPFDPRFPEDVLHLLGILSAKYRIEILAVHVSIGSRGGRNIIGRIRSGILRLEIYNQPDSSIARIRRTKHFDGLPVRSQDIVRSNRCLEEVSMPRGQLSVEIPAVADYPWLVDRRPHLHPVPKRLEHHLGVFGEPVRDIAIEPSAQVIECRWKIPVIKGRVWRDSFFEQCVHKPRIKIDSLLIGLSHSIGKYTRPRYAEPVGI